MSDTIVKIRDCDALWAPGHAPGSSSGLHHDCELILQYRKWVSVWPIKYNVHVDPFIYHQFVYCDQPFVMRSLIPIHGRVTPTTTLFPLMANHINDTDFSSFFQLHRPPTCPSTLNESSSDSEPKSSHIGAAILTVRDTTTRG